MIDPIGPDLIKSSERLHTAHSCMHWRDFPQDDSHHFTDDLFILHQNQHSTMKVTFSETSEMYIVDCFLEEVSPDKIWFTRDELDSFRSNVVNHIKSLRSQEQEGRILLPADSVIGLERFITREVTEESQRRKNVLMREVLHSTVHDQADRLAKISAEYSTWAQARAQQSAIFLEAVLVCEDLDQHFSNYLFEHSFVSGI